MSKILKFTLNQKSGLLTPLHSDTIFGHFCWRLTEKYGTEKLASFLNYYTKGEPIFTVSDGLPELAGQVYFPKPLLPSVFTASTKGKMDAISEFQRHKKCRKIKYINAESLNNFLNFKKPQDSSTSKEKEISQKSPSVKLPSEIEDLRVNVSIDRKTLKSKKGFLFSSNPVYPGFSKEIKQSIKYALLVKVINEDLFNEFDVANLMISVFETGYGKKKSSGFGCFTISEPEEYTEIKEPEESNGFYLLGMYLPSKRDELIPEKSYYNFILKYGRLGENFALSVNPFKVPAIMFTKGSCFSSTVTRNFYGRITLPGEILPAKKEVQHNGIAFTLKMYQNQ